MSDRVGIMSQGVLQQVSTPMEIYNHPVNGFVASFVGENNIFDGKIASMSGGTCRFTTQFGEFGARVGPGVTESTAVRLYVRPEHASLSPEAAGSNSLPVTVGDVAFEGNFINVHCHDARGGSHMVQMQNDPTALPPQPGVSTHLNFTPDHAVVLADAAARGRA